MSAAGAAGGQVEHNTQPDVPKPDVKPAESQHSVYCCALLECGKSVSTSVKGAGGGLCSRCRLVGYCSSQHQALHWKGGHKSVCTSAPAAATAAPSPRTFLPPSSSLFTLAEEEEAKASLARTARLPPLRILLFGAVVPSSIGSVMKEWEAAAESGHAVAQYNVGHVYDLGSVPGGIKRNQKVAAQWFQKAASQGEAKAQFEVGILHENRGDFVSALVSFRKSAAQGNPSSQSLLGAWYENGKYGATADLSTAVAYYMLAANQNHPIAQKSLGVCFFLGRGVARDRALASKWLKKAAAQGNEEAGKCLRDLDSGWADSLIAS